MGQDSHEFRDLQRSVEKAHGDRERAFVDVDLVQIRPNMCADDPTCSFCRAPNLGVPSSHAGDKLES